MCFVEEKSTRPIQMCNHVGVSFAGFLLETVVGQFYLKPVGSQLAFVFFPIESSCSGASFHLESLFCALLCDLKLGDLISEAGAFSNQNKVGF